MIINKIPDRLDDEKIYGFQIITLGYAIDLYLCLNYLTSFYINYDRDFKDLAIKISFINIGFTNLKFKYEWEK
jgi:hypothetical protein